MHEHGDIAVELSVELELLDGFRPIQLESAVEVAELEAARGAHGQVEDLRWERLVDGVVPRLLPAAHDVIALFELREKAGYLLGIVLQIRVQRENEASAYAAKAGVERRSFAEV